MRMGIRRMMRSSLSTNVPSSRGFRRAGSAGSVAATIIMPTSDSANTPRYGLTKRSSRT
jgi:hypothetical protein